jgi:hypothetical protein
LTHAVGIQTRAARRERRGELSILTAADSNAEISVALFTGGIDKHYVYGLATALWSRGAVMDLIGRDGLDGPELRGIPSANFLNLRGDQRPDAKIIAKLLRISRHYAKLIRYAARSRASFFTSSGTAGSRRFTVRCSCFTTSSWARRWLLRPTA